jgi:hypothetical protein
MRRSLLQTALCAVVSLGIALPAFAQTYNGQQLQGRVTFVPAGTSLEAVLTSPIDSAVSKPGDLFSAKLYSPMYFGNDMVLPPNTTLEGQIIESDKGGHLGINGKMNLRLTAAVTPDGTRFPLSAIISANQADKKTVAEDKSGDLKGQSTKSSVGHGVARTAAWTAGGTLLGICFAPIVAGSVAAGAIAGVATGGAVGLGSNLWRKGKDVKVPSGSRLSFQLDQPMSLSANVAGTGYTH